MYETYRDDVVTCIYKKRFLQSEQVKEKGKITERKYNTN